jgi:cytochrome c553
MKKAIPKTAGGKRAGAGRPATGKDPVRTMRLSDEFIASVDAWAAKQDDQPGRSEAIRRLVERGLKAAKPFAKTSKRTSAKVKELAGQAIDALADPRASTEERAERKRRLLKGPEEFLDLRRDHKNK